MRGRTVLITGASRGLGAMLAWLGAADGAHLIVTARGAEALHARADALRAHGARVTAVAGDVADPAHRARLADAAGERLDVLVHNASTLGPSPLPRLLDVDAATLHAVLDTNLVAPLALTRALRPALAAGDGLVVHVSSDAARGGYAGWGAYGASKAALELAARTLAAEEPQLAPVLVDPGDLRTAMHQAAYPDEDISDRPLPEATAPFWRWLFAQEPAAVRGRRFEAQADVWDTAPAAPGAVA